ncbi:MAG: hydroxyacid dehydrogenase [Nanoarchaeota archaeon]
MKIAFYEINDWEKERIQKELAGHELFFFSETLNNENMQTDADIVSVFIYSDFTKEILKKFASLKMIVTRSAGFDHIDLNECNKRGITVTRVPSYGDNTVAEHTFALILSISRNIHRSYVRSQKNDFSIEGLKGFDLKGKTLGVIGAGKIGLHIIKMAKGFGMEVIAFDVDQDSFLEEVLGFKYVPFDDLLSRSDILSLNVPHNEHTHRLINSDNIEKIKKGAVLINTSRGAVVETDALLKALDRGILSGAGLDVIEGEELIKEEKQVLHDKNKPDELETLTKDHKLLKKENVVYTPHIAFYSQEALERIISTSIENIKTFLNGEEKNVVRK